MKTFHYSAFLALGVLLDGCGQAATSTSSDPSGSTSLSISSEDDYAVAGTFVHDVSVIDFASSVTTDGISTVDLTINGAKISVKVDLFTGEASESGAGETLMADDLTVLSAFAKYLDQNGKSVRPWERLYKAAAMYAAAPAGYTIVDRVIVATGHGAEARDGSGRNGGTVSNEDITYLCYGFGGYPLWNNDDWVWHEHDSVTGGMSSANEGGSAGHWRMQSFAPAGCRLDWNPGAIPGSTANQGTNPYWLGKNSGGSWTDGAGYNDSSSPNGYYGQGNTQSAWSGGGSCEGRCGPGCPTGIYNYYFTKDCFDHDVCLDYHRSASSTSSSGDCGYEYQDAQGDFISGSSSTYSSWCGPVPSSCPDNANGQADSTVNQG
jgi:hypothetical protein